MEIVDYRSIDIHMGATPSSRPQPNPSPHPDLFKLVQLETTPPLPLDLLKVFTWSLPRPVTGYR